MLHIHGEKYEQLEYLMGELNSYDYLGDANVIDLVDLLNSVMDERVIIAKHTIHYAEDDEECCSDYVSEEVEILGETFYFRDAYHESDDVVDGLIMATKFLTGKEVVVERIDVNDGQE